MSIEVNAALNGIAFIQLIDNTGRILRKQQCSLTTGLNLISINTIALPKGMYTIILQNETNNISRKLVKQ
jgi:hypothetical protein